MAEKKHVEFYKQTRPEPKTVKKVETDEILSGTDKFEYLIGQYWKQIVIVIAIIAVVIVTLIIVQLCRTAAFNEKGVKFADAKTVEEIEALLKDSPDHPAGIMAREKLANLYAEKNEFGKAITVLEEIRSVQGVAPYEIATVNMEIAYLLEKSGKIADAQNKFKALLDAQDLSDAQKWEVRYCAARLSVKLNDLKSAEDLLGITIKEGDDQVYLYAVYCVALKNEVQQKLHPAPVPAKAETKPAPAPAKPAPAKPAPAKPAPAKPAPAKPAPAKPAPAKPAPAK